MHTTFRTLSVSALCAATLAACPHPTPTPTPTPNACTLTDAEWTSLTTGHSVARQWDELVLHAIRRDLPAPTVHARTLFHLSAAMYDAWAAYDATAHGVFFTEKHTATDLEAARAEAVSHAAFGLLTERAQWAVNGDDAAGCYAAAMARLGYDAADTGTTGDGPAAVGNRVAAALIAHGQGDGANEQNFYADTTNWQPTNQPLVVARAGNQLADPDHWQQLQLARFITQNGLAQDGGVQQYVGAHWREVTPFAMKRAGAGPYHDAGVPPTIADPRMRRWLTEVVQKQAQLDLDGTSIDISPAALGNNPVGTNDGHGRPLNPSTGQPYAPNVVPLADFGRVLAEFWADGPNSETPPGHWNVLANNVADSPGFTRAWRGGAALPALEWDVKVYLTLNGALHDAAISAWELKRLYTCNRPISLLRWYGAAHGQASNDAGLSYDDAGLPEVAGLLEVVTPASSAYGQRHQYLAGSVGRFAVRGWAGQPPVPASQVTPIDWERLDDWVPYQKGTFVTPAFPGFISGHSTFSRAGAEVLAAVTGSDFFPGGLGTYTAPAHTWLTFEQGPSVQVQLQWATYFDAADQAGQSRIWGGIHIEPDDLEGRKVGQAVGRDAVAAAFAYFAGQTP